MNKETTSGLRHFFFLAIVLGFSSIVSQILFLREFLLVFSGNELVIGIILATWMILTGGGAYIGQFFEFVSHRKQYKTVSFILLGVLPVVTLFLVNYLRNIVFAPGITLDLSRMLLSVIIMLIPFCAISGFIFTLISSLFSELLQDKQIDKIYAFESLGSIIGGLLFTYFLSKYTTSFQILVLNLSLNLFTAFFLIKHSKYVRLLSGVIILLLISGSFYYDIDKKVHQYLFINQDLIYTKDTPFGNISITKYGDELNFFENNVLLFSTENVKANEEAAHYAMIQHSGPKNVMLISGGISGIVDEIFKYDVKNIDYIELNPEILKIGKEFSSLPDNKNIRFIREDARIFVKESTEKYDVILINLPEPLTAQLNRYYTVEFYNSLKNVLSSSGVISFGLPLTSNYLNEEGIRLNSTLYNTLKKCFRFVTIFPGEKNYFVASDSAIKLNIAGMIEKKGIQNDFVNRYYLNDTIIKERSLFIHSSLEEQARINSDFYPVTYFSQITYWLSQFKTRFNVFIIISLILFVVFFIVSFSSHVVNSGMYIIGYTGAALEFIFILIFQIIYGYVYKTMGLFFSVFMLGLALGPYIRKKFFRVPKMNHFILLQVILISIIIVSIPSIAIIKGAAANKYMVYPVIFSLLFIVALLVGTSFSTATILYKEKIKITAAKIYTTDLIGSAFGAFFTSVFFIPIFGIINSLLITAGFGIVSLIFTIWKVKK